MHFKDPGLPLYVARPHLAFLFCVCCIVQCAGQGRAWHSRAWQGKAVLHGMADQRGGGGVIDLVPTVVRDNSSPLPAAMITPGESAASLRFRERMHAHHRVYQEQIEANQEKEYRRAVAAREKRKKRTRDWERVVAAVMRGLAASRQTAAPAPAEGAPASAAAPPATPAPRTMTRKAPSESAQSSWQFED